MTVMISAMGGAELDYWVAIAEGYGETIHKGWPCFAEWAESNEWAPSENWSDAGPIIERERIELHEDRVGGGWCAYHRKTKTMMDGRTALEAAMRCFVASVYPHGVPAEEVEA